MTTKNSAATDLQSVRGIDFSKQGAAKRCRTIAEKSSGGAVQFAHCPDRKIVIRHNLRDKTPGQELFSEAKLDEYFIKELSTGQTSIVTRGALRMCEQIATATDVVKEAMTAFHEQAEVFRNETDKMVSAAKQRVSQLTDYNNRLATALNNLNKTLGDERMLRALENAEKIGSALALLDSLEKSGSLEKIMAALNPQK